MTIEIHVPDIGADEVEVTEILVKAGDKVAVDQSLLSVEGDKASMEVPASEAGVVKSINVKVGDKVKTGSLIMTFEGEGAAKEDAAPAKEEAKSDAKNEAKADKPKSGGASVQDIKVPDIGGDAVEVTEIMVKVGDTVSEEQSLLSVEGDKASMEVPAPFAGKVKEIKISVGDKVSTGSLIMVFETTGSADAAPAAEAEAPKAESKAETKAEAAPAKTETKAEAAPASNDG